LAELAAAVPPWQHALVSFADTLQAKRPILRLGRVRLRFDVHLLVGEQIPGLGWRRFAPALALAVSAAAAVGCVATLLLPSTTAAALPLGLLSVAAALGTVRLEMEDRARRGFVFNYATRTLRIDRTSRLLGSARTLLIPFSEIAEAGVTRAGNGAYALEVELKAGPRQPARVEVLIRDVPPAQVEDLFRLAEMARAAFGLIPPAPETSGDAARPPSEVPDRFLD